MAVLVENSDLPSVLANHGYYSKYPIVAPVQDSGGQTFNVKSYGAAGNGIADDTSAVTLAINAASAAGGGTVFLPAGTYKVTSSITPLSGVRIQGAGNSTVLAGYGVSFAILNNIATSGNPTTDIEICDLKIDGTNVTAPSYTPFTKGIYIQYTKRLKIHDIYVYNTYATGIGTDYLVDSVISRCVLDSCGVNGIAGGGATGSNGIGIGTGAYATESWIIADCVAVNCGNNGIMCEAQNPTINSEYMMIVNCLSYGNKNGYLDSGVSRVLFSNCLTWNNTQNGFYIDTGDVGSSQNLNPSEVWFSNCKAFNNGSAGNYDGFIYNDTLISSQITLASELHFDNCVAAYNTNNGFQIKNPTKVSMNNCRAYNNYNHGILAFSSAALMPFNDLSIRGGSFYNNSTINPNTQDGIRFGSSGAGTMSHAMISNVRCYDDNSHTVTDSAITTGTKILTSATAGFRSSMVGQAVTVTGAGVASGNLVTTIASWQSLTQVTLAANASTTVSNASTTWGSATQRYGISIAGTTNNTNIRVLDNDLYGNATAAFNAGTIATLQVRDNAGFNPNILFAQGSVTGATTFNQANGSRITATLTGNITVTLANGAGTGDTLMLELTQDGTGNRTVTWPANFKKAGGALVLSTGANAVDSITMIWDGTNWIESSRSMGVA